MTVTVLRLGHRISRDKRLSTHLMLAARAFGADKCIYSGQKDRSLENSIKSLCEEWGGEFSVKYARNWGKFIEKWGGLRVHLTMYGLPVMDVIGEIRDTDEDLLVIVGGAKVPGEVYGLADRNISVTSQPHSEVSALAVFLHEYFQGKELGLEFTGGRLKIKPSARGKDVNVSKD